ncbi:MAG: ClC family H(+)/Cl(-) exchange transporter [Lachnospiraceae bacterium]|nr:ClC family H(+)/Cl(-) exchange transporter [Lachnospiraceae bacterium]
MSKKDSTLRLLTDPKNLQVSLVIDGVIVGTAAALVSVVYRFLLGKAETFLFWAGDMIRQKPIMAVGWLALLFVIAFLCSRLLKWEPMISGSGIPQVSGELKGYLDVKPGRTIIGKLLGGTLCIIGGMSLGREGPSVQLGAMAGKLVSRIQGKNQTKEKNLITCGAAAGLAAAFNAPLSGLMFALEELHKNFNSYILICAMVGAVTADFISKGFFGVSTIFDYELQTHFPLRYYWILLLFGAVLGMLGAVYNRLMLLGQDFFKKISFLPQEIRLMIPFVMGLFLLYFLPDTLAGGHAMVALLEKGKDAVPLLLLLLIVKFIFSVFCFGSGAPGGIFFPLLVLGSYVGAILGKGVIFAFDLPETMIYNFIILAMAGFFSAIVRAPITGIVLIAEMTGTLEHLISLLIVSIVAYVVANLMNSSPIYDSLLERIVSGRKGQEQIEYPENKVLANFIVQCGSVLERKRISEIPDWPYRCLIVSIKRGEKELIPRGGTKLHASDMLTVLVDAGDLAKANEIISNLCRNRGSDGF